MSIRTYTEDDRMVASLIINRLMRRNGFPEWFKQIDGPTQMDICNSIADEIHAWNKADAARKTKALFASTEARVRQAALRKAGA